MISAFSAISAETCEAVMPEGVGSRKSMAKAAAAIEQPTVGTSQTACQFTPPGCVCNSTTLPVRKLPQRVPGPLDRNVIRLWAPARRFGGASRSMYSEPTMVK